MMSINETASSMNHIQYGGSRGIRMYSMAVNYNSPTSIRVMEVRNQPPSHRLINSTCPQSMSPNDTNYMILLNQGWMESMMKNKKKIYNS